MKALGGMLALTAVTNILVGCATADFTPYSGAQQNWPVAAGAFVDEQYAVPVYRGAPSRPYEVLGYLDAETAPVRRKSVVGFMARRARELGGNGLILLDKGSEYAGSVNTGSANATIVGNSATVIDSGSSVALIRGKGCAVVIRFLKGTRTR